MTESAHKEGFALYIHWPFCAAKCPYCDFNSHVRNEIDHDLFARALYAELAYFAQNTPKERLTSIFFGGGTPSLMQPALVAGLIKEAEKYFGFSDDIEITLEANPTSADAARFKGYFEGGVNRLSLGVQSLNNDDLQRLGRLHSAEEALQAIEMARKIFPRLSFDMIYARPGQSEEDWEKELSRALSFANDHLSLYQLTIEPGTAYERLYEAGKLVLPDDDAAFAMYEMTGEICSGFGLKGYEISNYAKAGAESRHNLTYWRYGNYIGIGAGAHGRLIMSGKKCATSNEKSPEKWAERVMQNGHGMIGQETLSNADQAREMALMGLRLEEGISLSRLLELNGKAIDEKALQALLEEGFLSLEADKLKATHRGRLVLNRVLGEVLN